ncbi:MAG: mechanosensitive ion channel family protein [Thermaerobacter sp.]|nr:mechanosensitive ion channel family protein [Thermaerobacter sp.]
MRSRVWQRVLALIGFGLVVIVLPRVLGASWPGSDAAVLWRGGLTVVWVALSWGLIRSARMAGLRQLREVPIERQGILNIGVQVLSGLLVIVALSVAADIWHVNLTGIAVGGALTGVVVGLAAQSTLGNVFAGVQLLSLRPMRVGEWVTLRSWMTGVDVAGRVEEINFFYTVLREGGVRRVVPNGAVTVATLTVDESQAAGVQQIVLPYRLSPADAKAMLAPYRKADVTELRVDCYVLRVEWMPGESGHTDRCGRVAERLAES